MTVFEVLNLAIQTCAIKVIGSITRSGNFIEKNNNIFGVGASMKKSSHTLVFLELSSFKRLSITPTNMWWSISLVADS
jgi:hypothetical protein